MRATSRLLGCRITLFTRKDCGLCDAARFVLSNVQHTRPFMIKVVDIMKPEAKPWRDLYDFDVPVVHFTKDTNPDEQPELASQALKLMHRITPEEVNEKMDEAERQPDA